MYKNDKTVDYNPIIYILIIIIARPFINAGVFMRTRRKCAAATIYKRLDSDLITSSPFSVSMLPQQTQTIDLMLV